MTNVAEPTWTRKRLTATPSETTELRDQDSDTDKHLINYFISFSRFIYLLLSALVSVVRECIECVVIVTGIVCFL